MLFTRRDAVAFPPNQYLGTVSGVKGKFIRLGIMTGGVVDIDSSIRPIA